jgi:hypothetical protein
MKPGLVNWRGNQKPFFESREIQRGRNKGKVEVEIRLPTRAGVATKKKIVHPASIRRWPE